MTANKVQNKVEQVQEKVQESVQKVTASKRLRSYRAILFQGYIVTAVILFGALALLAHFTPYFPIDLVITKGIQQFNPRWFDELMKFVTYIGVIPQITVIIALMSLLLYLFGLKWEAVISLVTAAAASSLSVLIKTIVQRPRPGIDLVVVFQHLQDSSFPSGHVMLYTAFFGYFLFLSYAIVKNSFRRTLLIALFGLLIVLVGPSRIYLGEHWASDVFAAYLIGSLLLGFVTNLYKWGKTRFFMHQPTAPGKI